MNYWYIILLFLSLSYHSDYSDNIEVSYAQDDTDRPNIFKENKGQWNDNVNFRADFGTVKLWLEDDRFTWELEHQDDYEQLHHTFHPSAEENHDSHNEIRLRKHVFNMIFDGAFTPQIKASNPTKYYYNYLIGNDSARWAREVKQYESIYYSSLYHNIDLNFYTENNQLKYDFIVNPGGKIEDIKMKFNYVDDIQIIDGQLVINTSISTIKEDVPYVYQIINGKKNEIPCHFSLHNQTVSFEIDNEKYNPDYRLIIDPVLVFSSFSGSTADNFGMTATFGMNGELYGGGIVFSSGYPTSTGAYDVTYASGVVGNTVDIGITKFSADGTQMLYSTYIGGNYTDIPHSLIENSRGELVILASTSSVNYPITSSAYQRRLNENGSHDNINSIPAGPTDIAITVLNPNGTNLIGSTFLGGSENDGVNTKDYTLTHNYGDEIRGEVILDASDNIYIGSVTSSPDFPVTQGSYQQNYGGSFTDGILFSLNRTCSDLRFSTFFGGSSADAIYSLKRNQQGQIYAVGGTKSSNLNFRGQTYQSQYNSAIDGFILLFSENGSTLLSGTYNGTPSYDQIYFIDLDDDEYPFVYGQTEGTMPFTPGKYGQPRSGQFIQKFEKDLTSLQYGLTFGKGRNRTDLSPTAFLVDECNRIFISGWGGVVNMAPNATNGFEISDDAFQSTTDGSDFYLAVLEEDAEQLLYATYFGGNNPDAGDHVDGGTSRFSKDGTIYHAVCAGCRGTNDYPTTNGVVSEVNNSDNCNMGVFKFDFELSEINANIFAGIDTAGCFPYDVNFQNTTFGSNDFFWDFGDGNTSTIKNPVHQYERPGLYNVTLIARSTNICIEPDTAYIQINVKETVEGNRNDTILCDIDNYLISSSLDFDPEVKYTWNTGQNSNSIRVYNDGQYIVLANYLNCIYPDTFDVLFSVPQYHFDDIVHCTSADLFIELDPRATDIEWNTGQNTPNISITQEGLYWVKYKIYDCEFLDSGYVEFPILPIANIDGDTLACPQEVITLQGSETNNAQNVTYTWSTGNSTDAIDVTETGNYQLIITEESGCADTAQHFIRFYEPLPDLEEPEIEALICKGSSYMIDLSIYENNADILWSDGSTEYIREFTEDIELDYTISNICEELKGQISVIVSPYKSDDFPFYIPNAFSPNSDNINDIFKLEFNKSLVRIRSFRMLIYNRWGDLLYETDQILEGWNGNFNGEELKPGVYTYDVEITYFLCEKDHTEIRTGDVQVLR